MEYGSDFSVDLEKLNKTSDTVFRYLSDYDALYFDSGRSATRYLLRTVPHKRVALPAYLCESIPSCFPDSDIFYYPLDEHLQISSLDQIPWETLDVFYLLHYFGSLQSEESLQYIDKMRRKFGFLVIEDTTHSLFTSAITIGDYGVCSLRKWFPIPDGGVLYSKTALDRAGYDALTPRHSPRIHGMVLKALYLDGTVTDKGAFRKILLETEDALDAQDDLFKISVISEFLLGCESVTSIIHQRKENHACLKNAVGDLFDEMIPRKETDVPFIFVLRCENRNALRAYLTENQVYCPVHWPLPDDWVDSDAKHLSAKLISIPTDQRYHEADMLNITKIIRGFYHESV